MKIAIILFDRIPEIGGGYTYEAEVVQSLLQLVDESNHEFIIVSDSHAEVSNQFPHTNRQNISFIPYSRFPIIEKIINALRNRSSIARYFFKRNRFLENELNSSGVEFICFLGACLIQTDIPYMAVVWDLQHRLQPFFPEVSRRGLWEARESQHSHYLQRAAIVVTGNQAGKEEIERFYQVPSERIKILPHMTPKFALNPQKIKSDVLKKYNIPDKYLFYPAQFWPHKNHVNLLLAIKILREKYGLDFPLVLVGSDRGNLDHIKSLIAMHDLSSRVHILGFVPQEDLVALYRHAFALTYVSLFGPENLPPLEAFALGCPVIVMNVLGLRQQLGDAALYAEIGDPETIAIQISKLQTDINLYQQLQERGKKRASDWTSDDLVRGMFKVFDEFEYYRRCWKN